MKKTFVYIAALGILLSSAPAVSAQMADSVSIQASAQETVTIGDLTYIVYDDHVVLSSSAEDISGDVEIPAEALGLPVTAIGGKAFYQRKEIVSVIPPYSVRRDLSSGIQ